LFLSYVSVDVSLQIVPSFTPEDVHALGHIILAAFFYQALPGILGVLARYITVTSS
jgi:hypothetical protein